MSKQIGPRELLAYRAELRNDLFRQIHRRLRQLKSTGFTQKRLAQRLSMDEGQLSRCLRGETDLRLETLSDLARGLGCRITASLQPLEAVQVRQWTTIADYADNSDNDDDLTETSITGTEDANIEVTV